MTGSKLASLVMNSNTLMGGDDFWRELAEQTGVSIERVIDISLELQCHVNKKDFWEKFAIRISQTKIPT